MTVLRARDPALYKLGESWLESDTIEMKQLVSFLPDATAQSPDARLLLVTPYRAELELKRAHDLRGAGKASGLGFYLDTITPLKRGDTGERSFGYLGVFINFQLSLINVKTGTVEAPTASSSERRAPQLALKTRRPWNALSQEQEIKTLELLMKEGIQGALPRMLSSKAQ